MSQITGNQRVIVCLDGSAYSEAALESAVQRQKTVGGTLVGLTIVDTPGIKGSAPRAGSGPSSFAMQMVNDLEKKMDTRADHLLNKFAQKCDTNGISFIKRKRRGNPFEEIQKETLFADLLFCGKKLFFHYQPTEKEGYSLHEIFQLPVYCPVIAVAEKYYKAENIILAYDGSPQAANTIKSYIQLSASLSNNSRFYLIHVNESESAGEVIINEAESYLETHNVAVHKLLLSGNPKEELFKFCRSLKPGFLVLGASSKSFLATLMLGSLVKMVIEDPELPAFIYV